jgi:hypothetical protein
MRGNTALKTTEVITGLADFYCNGKKPMNVSVTEKANLCGE